MNDTTFYGQWVVDSETGQRVLIDLKINKIILREGENPDARKES